MISYNRLGSRHTQTLQYIKNDDVLKDDGKTSCVGNIEHIQTVSSLQLQMVPAGHDVQFLYTPMLYSFSCMVYVAAFHTQKHMCMYIHVR